MQTITVRRSIFHCPGTIAFFRSMMILLVLIILTSLPRLAAASNLLTEDELAELNKQIQETNQAINEHFRISVDQNDLAVNEDLPNEWWNILLLGTDTGGDINYGRTDAMLILSLQVNTGEIKLTSLLRDMWVDIPGMKQPNLINAANSFGGPYLSIKTVNTLLDMNIHDYCSINFSGLENLVDRVGGVSIEITKTEASIIGARLQEGGAVLNGEQALKFARLRSIDNNFGRNERQRKLLLALVKKILSSMNIPQRISLVTEMMDEIDTNMSLLNIFSLMNLFFKNQELQIDMLSLPPDDEWYFDYVDGKSRVIFDREATTLALYNFIYGNE
jgi:polyisoprenyl-teichoic acid--peptidoglycan teichoic acid transferase